MKVKTDNPNYLRDLSSSAILAKDIQSLTKHKQKINQVNEINSLRYEVDSLNLKIDKILKIIEKRN
jgi:soluble cytochrome b562